MAYWTAFPESHAKMDETFKQDLLNVVHEWVTGKSLTKTWSSGSSFNFIVEVPVHVLIFVGLKSMSLWFSKMYSTFRGCNTLDMDLFLMLCVDSTFKLKNYYFARNQIMPCIINSSGLSMKPLKLKELNLRYNPSN